MWTVQQITLCVEAVISGKSLGYTRIEFCCKCSLNRRTAWTLWNAIPKLHGPKVQKISRGRHYFAAKPDRPDADPDNGWKRRILKLCVQQGSQAPAEPQVLRRQLRELPWIEAELEKKFNGRVGLPQRFPRNDRLDTERYLQNRPHGRVKQGDTKPNGIKKSCFDELMLLWYFVNVCTSLRTKRIGKISPD